MGKQGEHGISWTEETWNPLRGCSRVSEGCRNCYAERTAARFSGPGQPYEGLARIENVARADGSTAGVRYLWTGEVRFIPEKLEEPLKWKRPRRVFVNSMSDLFHEKVADATIDSIFAVMALAPQHTFQVLTKRPERMLAYCQSLGKHNSTDRVSLAMKSLRPEGPGSWYSLTGDGWAFPNVHLGVSVEDQATADQRIPLLTKTPAAVRWVSYEPALGPVWWPSLLAPYPKGEKLVHWLVCGGESGPGARPLHPAWARQARDQCAGMGIPFHFKQWGEWRRDGEAGHFVRVGRQDAGRTLDGRLWEEYPRT